MRVVKMGNMAAIYTTIKKSVFDKTIKYRIEDGYVMRDDDDKITGSIAFGSLPSLFAIRTQVIFNAVDEETGTLKIEFPPQTDGDSTTDMLRAFLFATKDIIEEFERRYETLERGIDEKERSIDALITTL